MQIRYDELFMVARSQGFIRMFRTRSFTVRAFLVGFVRYSAKTDIIGFTTSKSLIENYPVFNNDGWIDEATVDKGYVNYLINPDDYRGIDLLSHNDYREALNIKYIHNFQDCMPLTKKPFLNERKDCEPKYNIRIRSKFGDIVLDYDNPYDNKPDILLDYNGFWVQKTVNGETYGGYLIINRRNDYIDYE